MVSPLSIGFEIIGSVAKQDYQQEEQISFNEIIQNKERRLIMSYEIAVVTGTRADFHLLTPLLHRIEKRSYFKIYI